MKQPGLSHIPEPEAERWQQDALQFWRVQIERDPFFAPVLTSAAFQRLQDISFLGALDYAARSPKQRTGSRADHSLNVAALANFVAVKRGYSRELSRHLILAGLLHDIGHPPLSHSAEPFIKKHIGYGHHLAGEKILKGQNELGETLHNWLEVHSDIPFLISLIDQRARYVDGGDLFASPINIDTIEGITRTYRLIEPGIAVHLNRQRVRLAEASFLSGMNTGLKDLDYFWTMKHRVYTNLITSTQGLLADKLSQLYFEQERAEFAEKDMFSSENLWRKQYAGLFENLKKINRKSLKVSWLSGRQVRYTTRSYYLDIEKRGLARYRCAKQGASVTLPAIQKLEEWPIQISLVE
ncbi:HD domain-containing protein [Marinobacter metalliresistant]|uniref:HD domain-containing protein n=1 Tax=Marinobacter metalliresistant TaxID=2961995 RepID=A0ABZ2W5V0_9GAMM